MIRINTIRSRPNLKLILKIDLCQQFIKKDANIIRGDKY
jgi:hypothetical protein